MWLFLTYCLGKCLHLVLLSQFWLVWIMPTFIWCGCSSAYWLGTYLQLVWLPLVLLSCDTCTFGVVISGSTVLWHMHIWWGYLRFYCLVTHAHLVRISQVLQSCDMCRFGVVIPQPTFLWHVQMRISQYSMVLGMPTMWGTKVWLYQSIQKLVLKCGSNEPNIQIKLIWSHSCCMEDISVIGTFLGSGSLVPNVWVLLPFLDPNIETLLWWKYIKDVVIMWLAWQTWLTQPGKFKLQLKSPSLNYDPNIRMRLDPKKMVKINEKHIISEYFDMLTSNSFYPKISVPTWLSNTHGTLIANFLCKLTDNALDTTSGVLIKKFSEHQPYFILLNNILTKDSPLENVKITKQDNEAIQKFHNEILTSDKLINLKSDLNEYPNNTYNILHSVIQDAKDKHIPTKLIKYNKYKHKKSKWVTFGIIKSIQFRDNLYKKTKNGRSSICWFCQTSN